jgi:hypothetical protein
MLLPSHWRHAGTPRHPHWPRLDDDVMGAALTEYEKILFGRRLAAWQALHGIEHEALALWLGMSRFRLSRLKSGQLTRASRAEAAHIAARLGMAPYGRSVELTLHGEQVAGEARALLARQAERELM